ncbi:hypothetical protein M0R19_00700 [Candidatus Pacearchaeota archaeon]|nr:hypothetical protein [Candidatus Pacearchaeota archaeon]
MVKKLFRSRGSYWYEYRSSDDDESERIRVVEISANSMEKLFEIKREYEKQWNCNLDHITKYIDWYIVNLIGLS